MVTFILILIAIILIPIALNVIVEAWPIFLILGILFLIGLGILILIAYPPLGSTILVLVGIYGFYLSLKEGQEKRKKRQEIKAIQDQNESKLLIASTTEKKKEVDTMDEINVIDILRGKYN